MEMSNLGNVLKNTGHTPDAMIKSWLDDNIHTPVEYNIEDGIINIPYDHYMTCNTLLVFDHVTFPPYVQFGRIRTPVRLIECNIGTSWACAKVKSLFIQNSTMTSLLNMPKECDVLNLNTPNLESLEGCPDISLTMRVNSQKLKNLVGMPKVFNGSLYVSNTGLTSLVGCSHTIYGDLDVSYNPNLKSFECGPINISGKFIKDND